MLAKLLSEMCHGVDLSAGAHAAALGPASLSHAALLLQAGDNVSERLWEYADYINHSWKFGNFEFSVATVIQGATIFLVALFVCFVRRSVSSAAPPDWRLSRVERKLDARTRHSTSACKIAPGGSRPERPSAGAARSAPAGTTRASEQAPRRLDQASPQP